MIVRAYIDNDDDGQFEVRIVLDREVWERLGQFSLPIQRAESIQGVLDLLKSYRDAFSNLFIIVQKETLSGREAYNVVSTSFQVVDNTGVGFIALHSIAEWGFVPSTRYPKPSS